MTCEDPQRNGKEIINARTTDRLKRKISIVDIQGKKEKKKNRR